MSGRFLADVRAPRAPLDYRALAAALRAYQSATPTARVVAQPVDEAERRSRELALRVVGAGDADRNDEAAR